MTADRELVILRQQAEWFEQHAARIAGQNQLGRESARVYRERARELRARIVELQDKETAA